ncbi:MAG: Smr/MutS family protein [Parvularculaceae bacterium]|nr:Smr/MutS family protein [Parvularculaceae bacterium]
MRKRILTEAERELWRRAVRDVKPARRPPKGVAPAKAIELPDAPGRTPVCAPVRASAHAQSANSPPLLRAPYFVFGGGDPAFDRAAASRRIAIDRIIDLHGLTQVEAHRLLLTRIPEALNKGERLVLVVTGKGGAIRPPRSGANARGVLRTRFFDWIEEPPLKGAIARVSQAKPKDGGAGAFYVFLKRKGAPTGRG